MAKGKTKKINNSKKSMGKIYHRKTEVDGIVFDSQTEAEYYEYLKVEKKAGRIKSFTMQETFILQDKFLIVDGVKIEGSDKNFKKLQKENPGCTIAAIKYIADFVVTYKNNTVRVIDVKGAKTVDFKLKEKIFNFKYPEYNKLYCVVKCAGQWMEYNEAQKYKKQKKQKK